LLWFNSTIATIKATHRTSEDSATVNASRLCWCKIADTEMHRVAVPAAAGNIRESANTQTAGEARPISGQTVAAK
jgi:hypothetical protein